MGVAGRLELRWSAEIANLKIELLRPTKKAGGREAPSFVPKWRWHPRTSFQVLWQNVLRGDRYQDIAGFVGDQHGAQGIFGLPLYVVRQYLPSGGHGGRFGFFKSRQILALIVFGDRIAVLEVDEKPGH
jgi:hypothetical protein